MMNNQININNFNNNKYNEIKQTIDSKVNKSFLILDQVHESYFPFLEKSIYLSHSLEKIDKTKISKTEFIIQQRINHVEDNCRHINFIIGKLPDNYPSKADLINRLKQLENEQKRIWSSFKAIQFKRVEKERVQREQEESLTRRFTGSMNESDDHQQFNNNNNNNSLSINIDEDSNNEKDHILRPSSSNKNLMTNNNYQIKLIRNQKPLVKRVRTRYLDISTDFFGMTKVFLKHSFIYWILLLGIFLFLVGVFFLIIWQTSIIQV